MRAWIVLLGLVLGVTTAARCEVHAPGAVRPALEPRAEAVRAALARALAEPVARSSARLLAECARDGKLPAVELFGRGFGIWDGRRQFPLAPETFRAALDAVRGAGLAEMPPSFGGRASATPAAPESDQSAIQVTCRLRLELPGLVKEVVQLDRGEQSAELKGLADAIYGLTAEAAKAGVEAATLEDGLEKVASGALAPETLALVLHRKPELQAGAGERPGFLLRLNGRSAHSERFTPGAGYGSTVELELGTAELAALCRALAESRPGSLPGNLWAPDYNDLSIRVLDRAITVQARAFSGMTPESHGEARVGFEAIAALLSALDERVQREGRPDVSPEE